MKRFWRKILVVVTGVALLLPVLNAAASAGEATVEVDAARRGLAVHAEQSATVGEPFKVQVTEKHNGQPVARAGVWAVAFDRNLMDATVAADVTASADVAVRPETPEIFLGWTDERGYVLPAIREAGLYVLVAAKDGFNPGFARIAVRPPSTKALAIRAPHSAVAGEPVTLKVYERATATGVAQAGVWAVPASIPMPANAEESAAFASKYGEFLGWTDRSGELTTEFARPDQYVLVAVKDTYVPGFARISVKPSGDKALGIKVTSSANAGEEVTIKVYDKNDGSGVPLAGVWAISGPNAVLTVDDVATAELAAKHGEFLGRTDRQGELSHKFEKAGSYLLVAVKEGYANGHARIKVLSPDEKSLIIRAPEAARVGQPVSIQVLEKSALTVEIPVAKAGVWAVDFRNAATLDADQDYAAVTQKHGLFLGWTNEKGYVDPAPKFEAGGQYWLVAVKEGYVPGIARISVLAITTVTPKPVGPASLTPAKIEANVDAAVKIEAAPDESVTGVRRVVRDVSEAIRRLISPTPKPAVEADATVSVDQ